jgi:methylenetetrahydrofolate reductase (NADPH)
MSMSTTPASLKQRMQQGSDFLLGVELVSTRGLMSENKALKTRDFGLQLAELSQIDWVSITDNAGGNPMLGPAALGRPILDAGKEVIIHLSCKDFNRNGLESEAWLLASEGFHNILALSGDYPERGIAGMAKPVFDTDSIGLIHMLEKMNQGLEVAATHPKKASRLQSTRFFTGAVTTNFKFHENEVVPQYLKLEKKIEVGAQFIINQIGYDSRKIHELICYLKHRGFSEVPLIGNVYLLNPSVARLFHQQKIPGVVLSDELLAICTQRERSPDRGKAFFLELAAKQLAIYRGLGYRGAYLGGVHHFPEIEKILEIERSFSDGDWRQFAREIRFSRPGEFFLLAEDLETRLADPDRLNPTYEVSLNTRKATHNVDASYRLSKWVHDTMFTPGSKMWNLGKKLCRGSQDPQQGPSWMRSVEHVGKSIMFGCKDCGDCSLPEIGFLCPESSCAKNQRNGPCGGTRDGKCEVDDFECIWSRAYDRSKYEGQEQQLLAHAPVIQDQGLRGTSSWANTWLERDHLAKRHLTTISPNPRPFSKSTETSLESQPTTPVKVHA